MAIVRQYQYIPPDYDPFIGEVSARQSTSFKVSGTGFVSVWTGSGFKYDAQGYLIDGVISGTTWHIAGRIAFKMEGLGTSIATLRNSSDPASTFLAGADTFYGHNGQDIMNLGRGNDSYYAARGDDILTEFGAGNDLLSGQAGSDTIYASAGADLLDGGVHDDRLFGQSGNDTLIGGHGRDNLYGGIGSDEFAYKNQTDSVRGARRDIVQDFSRVQGDKIDLSAVDANGTSAGDGAFKYVGAKAFGGTRGELRFADGILSADIDGDRVADFEIQVVSALPVGKADLIL